MCKPGETYNDGCNDCVCVGRNLTYCTLMMCWVPADDTDDMVPYTPADPPEYYYHYETVEESEKTENSDYPEGPQIAHVDYDG